MSNYIQDSRSPLQKAIEKAKEAKEYWDEWGDDVVDLEEVVTILQEMELEMIQQFEKQQTIIDELN